MDGAVTYHEQKLTLCLDLEIPDHAERTTTSLFSRTRLQLLEIAGHRCQRCGRTAEESGSPLQSHHSPLERCYGEQIDWDRVREAISQGLWFYSEAQLARARAFDWSKFESPYSFIDDQLVNGVILCQECHIGPGTGLHAMSHANWLAYWFLKAGDEFAKGESVVHDENEVLKAAEAVPQQ